MEENSVYQKIKGFVFTLIYFLLWARFIVAIGDPIMGENLPSSGYSLFTAWRGALDSLYLASGYLMLPAQLIFQLVKPLIPTVAWLPTLESSRAIEMILAIPNAGGLRASLTAPEASRLFVGEFQWLVFIAVVFFKLLSPVLDWIIDFLKNIVWNVLIEFSFTKKKQAIYQEKLEKRAADLMKLKVEYKNLSKEASALAESVITDELTSLYNKRFFIQRVTDEFAEAKQKRDLFSIVMVDIDHFKKLNDTYGHLMGDKVLKLVALQVKNNTPKGCYACRFGGEEFAVIMPRKTPAEAMQIAQAIHEKIPQLRYEEDPNLVVTISMGLMSADFQKEEAQEQLQKFDDVIKLADDQLYHAKLNGRNRIEQNQIC